MPKLYYGSRGGVYYKRKGHKIYVSRFGSDGFIGPASKSISDNEKEYAAINDFETLEEYFVGILGGVKTSPIYQFKDSDIFKEDWENTSSYEYLKKMNELGFITIDSQDGKKEERDVMKVKSYVLGYIKNDKIPLMLECLNDVYVCVGEPFTKFYAKTFKKEINRKMFDKKYDNFVRKFKTIETDLFYLNFFKNCCLNLPNNEDNEDNIISKFLPGTEEKYNNNEHPYYPYYGVVINAHGTLQEAPLMLKYMNDDFMKKFLDNYSLVHVMDLEFSKPADELFGKIVKCLKELQKTNSFGYY